MKGKNHMNILKKIAANEVLKNDILDILQYAKDFDKQQAESLVDTMLSHGAADVQSRLADTIKIFKQFSNKEAKQLLGTRLLNGLKGIANPRLKFNSMLAFDQLINIANNIEIDGIKKLLQEYIDKGNVTDNNIQDWFKIAKCSLDLLDKKPVINRFVSNINDALQDSGDIGNVDRIISDIALFNTAYRNLSQLNDTLKPYIGEESSEICNKLFKILKAADETKLADINQQFRQITLLATNYDSNNEKYTSLLDTLFTALSEQPAKILASEKFQNYVNNNFNVRFNDIEKSLKTKLRKNIQNIFQNILSNDALASLLAVVDNLKLSSTNLDATLVDDILACLYPIANRISKYKQYSQWIEKYIMPILKDDIKNFDKHSLQQVIQDLNNEDSKLFQELINIYNIQYLKTNFLDEYAEQIDRYLQGRISKNDVFNYIVKNYQHESSHNLTFRQIALACNKASEMGKDIKNDIVEVLKNYNKQNCDKILAFLQDNAGTLVNSKKSITVQSIKAFVRDQQLASYLEIMPNELYTAWRLDNAKKPEHLSMLYQRLQELDQIANAADIQNRIANARTSIYLKAGSPAKEFVENIPLLLKEYFTSTKTFHSNEENSPRNILKRFNDITKYINNLRNQEEKSPEKLSTEDEYQLLVERYKDINLVKDNPNTYFIIQDLERIARLKDVEAKVKVKTGYSRILGSMLWDKLYKELTKPAIKNLKSADRVIEQRDCITKFINQYQDAIQILEKELSPSQDNNNYEILYEDNPKAIDIIKSYLGKGYMTANGSHPINLWAIVLQKYQSLLSAAPTSQDLYKLFKQYYDQEHNECINAGIKQISEVESNYIWCCLDDNDPMMQHFYQVIANAPANINMWEQNESKIWPVEKPWQHITNIVMRSLASPGELARFDSSGKYFGPEFGNINTPIALQIPEKEDVKKPERAVEISEKSNLSEYNNPTEYNKPLNNERFEGRKTKMGPNGIAPSSLMTPLEQAMRNNTGTNNIARRILGYRRER